MRKNIWLFLFLIFLLVILLARCVSVQYFIDDIGEAPLEIAPYRERTIELVNIYYGDAENQYLRREQRAIERTTESKEEVLVREIIKGPTSRILSPTIPPQTRVFSVSTVNGVTYVNLSREFVTNFRGGERAETTAIYSIVNTLTEVRNVKKVQILVEGEKLDKYQNHLSLREPYSRNENIIDGPLPTPIEVLTNYFEYIATGEFRRAFDEIYRPLDYNLDYAMFFRFMRFDKHQLENLTITSYRLYKKEEGGTIFVDYLEELKNGQVIEHKGVEFHYKNEFGEWKLVYREI